MFTKSYLYLLASNQTFLKYNLYWINIYNQLISEYVLCNVCIYDDECFSTAIYEIIVK